MDGDPATCVRCGLSLVAGVRVCSCGQPVPGALPAPLPIAEAAARTQRKVSAPAIIENALDEPPQTGAGDDARFHTGDTILGHYTVVRQLGRGGMGTVYLARDEVSGQEVAVKVLPASLARERDIRERFIQEARALASLDHPNIVPLVTFSQEGEDRFLVMKYLQGEPLDARLRRLGVLAPEHARIVTRAVLSALGYAHARGVIHRDVKPSNVIIEGDLDKGDGALVRVFLVDFGIAKKQEDGHSLTQTGMLMGTPQYMSPEQISGQAVDGRSDLYAAGLVLFEMLAGHPPFDGQKTFQVLRAHVEQPVPDLRAARAQSGKAPDHRDSDIPDDIEAICYGLLRKDPNERPRNAADAISLLDGTTTLPSLRHTDKHAKLTPPTAALSVVERSAPITVAHLNEATEDSFGDEPSLDEIAAVRSRRNPIVFVAALAIAAVAVGGLAFAKPFGAGGGETSASADAGESRAHGVDKAAFLLLAQRARAALKDHNVKDASYAIEAAVLEEPSDAAARSVQVDVRIASNQADDAESALLDLKKLIDGKTDAAIVSHVAEQEAALAALRAPKVAAVKAPQKHDDPPQKTIPKRPPATSSATSSASSSSTVPDSAIHAAANGTKSAIGDCYTNKVLSKDPRAGGVVTFNVRIKPTGRVDSVDLHGAGILGNPAFALCVANVIKGSWRFAPFHGDTTSVAYTVDLHP